MPAVLTRAALLTAISLVCGQANAQSPCNPTSVGACQIPFPSDTWSIPSASSPTGITLAMPDNVVSDGVFYKLDINWGYTPSRLFQGSGYSAAMPVLFELVEDTPVTALDENDGITITAYDVTTGEPIMTRSAISEYALSDDVASPSNILEVFPESRWPFGHQILVVLEDRLERLPASQFNWASAPNDTSGYTASVLAAVSRLLPDTSHVVNATLFTVRDREEITQPLRNKIAEVRALDHPVRNLEVIPNYLNSDIVARVEGELMVYNYRNEDGIGEVNFNGTPKEQWVEFRMTLPATSQETPAPVVLYLHGLNSSKEADWIVTDMLAEIGLATFAISFPNHGNRAEADGGRAIDADIMQSVPVGLGMIVQSTIDFASAHRALETSLRDLDVTGGGSWYNWCAECPDGQPDIDVDRVMMMGTSLGGVLGTAYGSLSETIDAGVYRVTGVGASRILSQSKLWDWVYSDLEPVEANGAEAVFLRGGMQQVIDFGDPVNFLDLFRYPPEGQAPRPLMLTSGLNDSLVPNSASVAAAIIAGLPLVGNELFEIPGVETYTDYEEPYAMRQYPPLTGTVPVLWDGQLATGTSDLSSHFIFFRADSENDEQEFIRRFIFPE